MPTDIVRFAIVRLCECEGNVEGRVACHGPLTDCGRRQAVAARRYLSEFGIRACAVPDNPACKETAIIIGGGAALHPAGEFREPPYPEYAGLTLDEVKQRFPDQIRRLFKPEPGDVEVPIPKDGESFRATSDRAIAGLRRLYSEFSPDPGVVVVVTHGEVVRLLTAQLLGAPLENLYRLRGRNGGVTMFDFDGHIASFEMINGTGHLHGLPARDLYDDIVPLA